MRDGWIATTLGDIADVQMGLQLSPSRRSGERPRPYLRAANIINQRISTSDVNEMDFTVEEEARFQVLAGDTLLVEGGNEKSLGMPAQAFEEHAGLCIQNTLIRLRTRDSQYVDPTFLQLICRHLFETRWFERMGKGTTILHLGGSRVPKVPCRVPELSEQHRIVDMMGAVDAYVAAADARVEAARTARTALLTALLSDVHEGWLTGSLGDFVRLQRGYDLPTVTRGQGVVPVISSTGVSGTTDTAQVAAPGVVTGRFGTLGKVFYSEVDFWPLNTTLFVSEFGDTLPRFVAYLLEYMDLSQFRSSSAVPGVNRNVLHQQRVHIPPKPLQAQLCAILGAADEALEAGSRHSDAARNFRGALLTDLLSGTHEIPASYDRFLEAA